MTLKGTTPTLTIGDAGAEDTKIVFDGNAQDYYIGLDDSADDLIIGLGSTVGTTPAVVIDENLNVGIGGTPSSLLHLGGATNKGIEITSSTSNAGYLSVYQDQAIFGINRDGSDGSFADTGKAAAVVKLTSADADSSISFQTTTSNNAEPNVRATIDKDGNFGIGTASPFSKTQITETGWSSGAPYGTVLTVTGNNTNDANWGHLIISDSSTGTGNGGMLRFAVGSTSSDISPHAGIDGFTEGSNYGGLKFLTRANGGTATERMRIASDGYISMTRSASEYGLQLKSTGTRSGLVVMKPGTDTIMGSVLLIGSNEYFSLGTASYYHVQCFQNGRTHIVGDYSFGGSNVSDRDMKENIIEVEGTSLEKILKLPIKSFKYKETDTEAHHISGNVQERKQKTGFIAQEVQPHLPDVVTGTDGKGDMALDPIGITAHLVRALQEQQTLIETLQAKVEALENG
jgi:hypothetical protein